MEIWESVVRMVSALGVVLALILGLLAVARSTGMKNSGLSAPLLRPLGLCQTRPSVPRKEKLPAVPHDQPRS